LSPKLAVPLSTYASLVPPRRRFEYVELDIIKRTMVLALTLARSCFQRRIGAAPSRLDFFVPFETAAERSTNPSSKEEI
jgi:hypothetical protein